MIGQLGELRILALAAGLLGASLSPPHLLAQTSREVDNLRAFAKLYGYVRFFHPSDRAASIDWDKLAIYGAGEVKNARSPEQLAETLERIFQPIAPSVRVYRSGSEPPAPLDLSPDDTAGLSVIAWQHLGVTLSGGARTPYRSVRLNRQNRTPARGAGFGTVTQGLDAQPYRGKRVKLRAAVRTAVSGVSGQGQLWLRVDREERRPGFFDNMADRPIRSSEWQVHEIVGDVADDAVAIFFGGFLLGAGRVWLDDFELLVEEAGEWQPIGVRNPGFEEGYAGGRPSGWAALSPGCEYEVITSDPHSGERSLLISAEASTAPGALFTAHASVGEMIQKEIGGGLACQVPLALYGESLTTFEPTPKYPLDRLKATLDELERRHLTLDDDAVRLAGIVIAWNVFQHFYPYFDVIEVDWDAQLTLALRGALTDRDGREFHQTLRRLVASLRDGHGGVYHPEYSGGALLPFAADWIESRVVVTATADSQIKTGDVVITIDGRGAEEVLLEEERFISGSDQWRRYRALRTFGAGSEGSVARLTVERSGRRRAIEVVRTRREQIEEPRPASIEQLEDGIFYVDLSRAPMSQITPRLSELAGAAGVIFDLRGYPRDNTPVIGHLLDRPDTSWAWMRIPQIIYPDREKIVGYQNHGWGLQPLQPHITGRVVFLTDGRAISYAESYMSFIEHYRLAEIVGQPTAGTNGNVNVLLLPGGFRIPWTGMRVVKHDGSQHHLVGILPTVPVNRTVEGVIDGRDEFLEKALELIKGE